MTRGVLFDVDGTLVDTNYLHAMAWGEAFRTYGHDVPMSTVHGLIGQGSDRLVDSVIGKQDEDIVDAHSDIFGAWLHRIPAFSGAADLLRRTQQSGLTVVLATSAGKHEAAHMTRAIDADDAIGHITTKDDASQSKPAPDIVAAALEGAGLDAADCLFVGDTVWDVEAAERAGVKCVCVLTGGIAESVLRDAGAIGVYASVAELLADFDRSPLGELAARAS